MSLVLIHAQAPWGPVSLRTAMSMADLLTRLQGMPGSAPAHVEDVGERDPADVVREALRLLPPPMDATGLIPSTVEKARISVVEAVSRVLARVVATGPAEPVSGKPESHGGPMVLDRVAEPEIAREAAADSNTRATISNPFRRRPGAEVDAREIRTKLGMSQPEFARAFGLKVATVRDWDQGRTSPDGAARSLLVLIEHRPSMVKDVLARYGVPVGTE